MIVLDTNVFSALMNPEANAAILPWFDRQPTSTVWSTSITLLEIRYGLLILPHGRRRQALTIRFERIVATILNTRILPFDREAAECAAEIAATRRLRARAVGPADTQIAGIVMSRKATLATRNIRDFDDLDISLVDPWAA